MNKKSGIQLAKEIFRRSLWIGCIGLEKCKPIVKMIGEFHLFLEYPEYDT